LIKAKIKNGSIELENLLTVDSHVSLIGYQRETDLFMHNTIK